MPGRAPPPGRAPLPRRAPGRPGLHRRPGCHGRDPGAHGGIPDARGRRFLPDLRQQPGDIGHDSGRGGPQRAGGQPLARVGGQVHRRPGGHLDRLARPQPRLLRPVGQDVLRPPVRDRDDRRAGGQREPGDAGLGHHRPQVRVAGRGPFRVDDHARAARQGPLRLLQDQAGVAAPPVHRQLAQLEHQRPDHLHLEDGRLDHEHRVTVPVGVGEQGERGPVGVGQVVGSQDHPAGLREVLLALPLVPDRQPEPGPQDDLGEPPPGR